LIVFDGVLDVQALAAARASGKKANPHRCAAEASMRIDGKVALVTGASRGIGRAVAIALASRGAAVAITARTLDPGASLPGSLSETVAAIETRGGEARPFAADLSVTDEVVALGEAVLGWRGRIDILVNNAAFLGKPTYQSIGELSVANWVRQLNVNLTAPFILSRCAVPPMRANGGGCIVNVTGGGGNVQRSGELKEGDVPGLVYGCSKLALNRLTFDIARDVRDDDIAVFAVGPGFVRSGTAEVAAAATGLDLADAIAPAVPAEGIVELVERDAGDVTGRIWDIVEGQSPVLRTDGRRH
jgi:citronellol/citronellal dehydrogenase